MFLLTLLLFWFIYFNTQVKSVWNVCYCLFSPFVVLGISLLLMWISSMTIWWKKINEDLVLCLPKILVLSRHNAVFHVSSRRRCFLRSVQKWCRFYEVVSLNLAIWGHGCSLILSFLLWFLVSKMLWCRWSNVAFIVICAYP